MARRTREEIQKQVAERSAARKETYFKSQAESKTKAAASMTEVPQSDAYIYTNVWRQEAGSPGGRFSLVKTVNPYYNPADNTIFDPITKTYREASVSKVSTNLAFPKGLISVPGKSVTSITRNPDGNYTIRYSDGTRTTATPTAAQTGDKNVYTLTPNDIKNWGLTDYFPGVTADNTADNGGFKFEDGELTLNGVPYTGMHNGTYFKNGIASTSKNVADGSTTDTGLTARQSAYDFLFEQFNQYGLGSLVENIKELVTSNVPPGEFAIRLRETPAYKSRFAANAARIAKGLSALSEAEYIGLEDQYQNIMRQYGLPEAYYARGEMGRQQGFEKFISSDVSPAELEDRIQTAQNRVLYAAPEVTQSLREFYPDITNGDILAYALDPEQALTNIKRKVTAAEIGAGARQAGLGAGVARAEELARYGVTGAQAREGFQAVAGVLPRASMLADIYAKQEVGPYTQTTAEQEVFGLAGAAEAQRKRQKLSALEQAQFAGSSGAAGGALSRERAGQF